MKTKAKIRLITERRRQMAIEALSNPYPSAANLRWVHYLMESAMDRNGIKPYPRKAR